jgi:hypothetical protein
MPTISLQQKHAELDAHNAKQLAAFARESDDHLTMKSAKGATPAGDELRLRGVPIQARGVGGTIRGTQPHTALR